MGIVPSSKQVNVWSTMNKYAIIHWQIYAIVKLCVNFILEDNTGSTFFTRTCVRRKGQIRDDFEPSNGVCYDWRDPFQAKQVFSTPLFSDEASHGKMRVFHGEICKGDFCNEKGEEEFFAGEKRGFERGNELQEIKSKLQELLKEN